MKPRFIVILHLLFADLTLEISLLFLRFLFELNFAILVVTFVSVKSHENGISLWTQVTHIFHLLSKALN